MVDFASVRDQQALDAWLAALRGSLEALRKPAGVRRGSRGCGIRHGHGAHRGEEQLLEGRRDPALPYVPAGADGRPRARVSGARSPRRGRPLARRTRRSCGVSGGGCHARRSRRRRGGDPRLPLPQPTTSRTTEDAAARDLLWRHWGRSCRGHASRVARQREPEGAPERVPDPARRRASSETTRPTGFSRGSSSTRGAATKRSSALPWITGRACSEKTGRAPRRERPPPCRCPSTRSRHWRAGALLSARGKGRTASGATVVEALLLRPGRGRRCSRPWRPRATRASARRRRRSWRRAVPCPSRLALAVAPHERATVEPRGAQLHAERPAGGDRRTSRPPRRRACTIEPRCGRPWPSRAPSPTTSSPRSRRARTSQGASGDGA